MIKIVSALQNLSTKLYPFYTWYLIVSILVCGINNPVILTKFCCGCFFTIKWKWMLHFIFCYYSGYMSLRYLCYVLFLIARICQNGYKNMLSTVTDEYLQLPRQVLGQLYWERTSDVCEVFLSSCISLLGNIWLP